MVRASSGNLVSGSLKSEGRCPVHTWTLHSLKLSTIYAVYLMLPLLNLPSCREACACDTSTGSGPSWPLQRVPCARTNAFKQMCLRAASQKKQCALVSTVRPQTPARHQMMFGASPWSFGGLLVRDGLAWLASQKIVRRCSVLSTEVHAHSNVMKRYLLASASGDLSWHGQMHLKKSAVTVCRVCLCCCSGKLLGHPCRSSQENLPSTSVQLSTDQASWHCVSVAVDVSSRREEPGTRPTLPQPISRP